MKLRMVFFCVGMSFLCAGAGMTMEADSSTAVSAEAPDYCPVCGPEEEMHGLALGYKHDGTKYTFCSMGCLKAFKESPEKFLDPSYSPERHAQA